MRKFAGVVAASLCAAAAAGCTSGAGSSVPTSTRVLDDTVMQDSGAEPQAASSTAAGRSTSTTDLAEGFTLAELTSETGCGYGFQVVDASQHRGLFVRVPVNQLEPPHDTYVFEFGSDDAPPGALAEIRIGSDLFAQWCNDAPTGPGPVVHEVWPITAGKVDVRITTSSDGYRSAVGSFTGLQAEMPDGTVVLLGDITIDNPGWGILAG